MDPVAWLYRPATPAFAALSGLVEQTTRRKVILGDALDEYSAHAGTIGVPQNDVEALLHELAHWVMAGPRLRDEDDYGLDESQRGRHLRNLQQEIMCGWLQEDLCKRAEIVRPRSSVDAVDFYAHPWLRAIALSRWRRYVGWQVRQAVVEVLRLPGGDVGLWAG